MGSFNLEDYEPVHERIKKFFEINKDGRIITELIKDNEKEFTFKSFLFKNAEEQEKNLPLSCGWANEIRGKGFVNQTCACENAETSSIGRALANLGLHGDKRPSREEMQKVKLGEKKAASTELTTKEKEAKSAIAKNMREMKCPDDDMGKWVETKRINGGYPYIGVLSITTDMLASGFVWDNGAKDFIKQHTENEPLKEGDVPY